MLALGFLLVVSADEGRAEVVVQRDHSNIRVSVENDTVGHVLDALGRNGNFRYRSTAPLDKVIGGDFSGSWGQVLSGVLAGFDFVVAYRPQGVEIVIRREWRKAHLGPAHREPATSSSFGVRGAGDARRQPPAEPFGATAPSENDTATSNPSMGR
jgi:hypothetical protein